MSRSSFTTGENGYYFLVMEEEVRAVPTRPRIILESMVGFKKLFADHCLQTIIIKVRDVLDATC